MTGDVSRRIRAVSIGLAWVPPLLAVAVVLFQAAPTAHARQPAPTDTADVRRVFLSDCAVCHGSDARGTGRGPSLVGVGRASLDYQLSTGRMPLTEVGRSDDEPGRPLQPLPNQAESDPTLSADRHAPAYPEATISALVDYVANLAGGGGPDIPTVRPGNLAEGGDLFRDQCAACHAWAGDGGALLRREAPALHQATPVQVAEAIRVGPGQMPGFGEAALTEDQVDSVVAYVRYLNHPDDRGGQPLWHLGPFTEGAVALVALGALLVFTRWIGERG